MHDVPYFDRFAPLYDIFLPATDGTPIELGLGYAERPVERVLDLGGGTGRASRAIGSESVIFDASDKMLAQADDNGHPTVRGDVRSLPLRSETVDAVVSVDAIHHLPTVETVLGEVSRILKPGGVFVIRDFDPTTVRGRGLAMAEHLVGFESVFFSVSDLTDMLARADFEPVVLDAGFVYTVVGTK